MKQNAVKETIDEQPQTVGEAAQPSTSADNHPAPERPEPVSEAAEGREEALRAELRATQDQLLRQAAEFQNYRRRTEQEKGRLIEYGRSQVVQQLLDVVDDFRRSLEAAEQAVAQEESGTAYQGLKEGVDLVFRKFMDELARLGVEPIEAVGKPFDEQEHEALMQQPASEETPPGIVLSEVQKGYRMGDRVLRHSKVVVSA